MSIMLKQLHLAAQYLAAAGKSFIDVKNDDSHTNLEWSVEEHVLRTWPLSKYEDLLSLNYKSFSLIWTNQLDYSNELFLDGKSHAEIIEWLQTHSKEKLGKSYNYNLHYELPYSFPSNDYSYKLSSLKDIDIISNLLDIGQKSFKQVLTKENLSSSIRVWPHHFDLGCFVTPDDTISIGFGLAIPDSAIDDFYYYVSGYHGDESIETKNFKALNIGEWQTGNWKAATYKATGAIQENIVLFLSEAINRFLD